MSEAIEWLKGIRSPMAGRVIADYDQLKAENERLSKITCVTMGVGNGSGSLFVHGDYESIKAAQAVVIERDILRKQLDEARAFLFYASNYMESPLIDAWLEANPPQQTPQP